MNVTQALLMAQELMEQHGLRDWKFKFDSSVSRFGVCKASRKTISISKKLVCLNPEVHVRNTILHEIAHAKLNGMHGHGPLWKKVAREVGCVPRACYSSDVLTPPKMHVGTCPNCLRIIKRYRRRKIACARCCAEHNNGVFSSLYLFKWKV